MSIRHTFTQLSALAMMLLATAISSAANTSAPIGLVARHKPDKPFWTPVTAAVVKSSITLKLREGESPLVMADRLVVQEGSDLARVRDALASSPVTSLNYLFSFPKELLSAAKRTGEAASGRELADLSLYLEVKLPAQIPTAEAESIVSRLNSLPTVEIAYFDPVPAPLPGVDIAPPTPNFTPNQGYLQPAPQGVDATYAWAYQGGRGANVNIIDVEYAWNTAHEDLPPTFISIGTPYLGFGDSHGTSVLGILSGDPNGYGVSGIAGEARIGVSSAHPNLPSAIFSAYASLAPGDVILIEQQTGGPIPAGNGGGGGANGYVPVEYVQSIFDVISTATANQRVVVQAAGNGSVNLDDVAFGGKFNRLVRDSSAIIVGAGTSSSRAPQSFTTYGSRLDVQGWGDSVATTGGGDLFNPGGDKNQHYTAYFSGTSSASAIVAGTSASLQGFFKARTGSVLAPSQLRSLLNSYGTPQALDSRQIGPLPDLRSTIMSMAGTNSRLANLAARAYVETGNGVVIGGITIGGSFPKTIVIRARGPSLVPFGIQEALANPLLQLYSGQTNVETNDDWATAPNASALVATGFAPSHPNESAILATLAPGAYTAIVSGVASTTGVGLVEFFEVDLPDEHLSNLSARADVLSGENVLIAGFVIQGSDPQTVVIRARGPSLIPAGISNALANPTLQLFNSGGAQIEANDDWVNAPYAPALTAIGFQPSHPLESAILVTLNPGAYTAIMSGVGGVTGVGIVEVFAR